MSGPIVRPLDDPQDQQLYDTLVNQVGCSNATDSLACLRQVPFSTFQAAVDATPSIFGYQVRIVVSFEFI